MVEILREYIVIYLYTPVTLRISPLGPDCDINLSKEEMKYQSLLQPQRTVSPAQRPLLYTDLYLLRSGQGCQG